MENHDGALYGQQMGSHLSYVVAAAAVEGTAVVYPGDRLGQTGRLVAAAAREVFDADSKEHGCCSG